MVRVGDFLQPLFDKLAAGRIIILPPGFHSLGQELIGLPAPPFGCYFLLGLFGFAALRLLRLVSHLFRPPLRGFGHPRLDLFAQRQQIRLIGRRQQALLDMGLADFQQPFGKTAPGLFQKLFGLQLQFLLALLFGHSGLSFGDSPLRLLAQSHQSFAARRHRQAFLDQVHALLRRPRFQALPRQPFVFPGDVLQSRQGLGIAPIQFQHPPIRCLRALLGLIRQQSGLESRLRLLQQRRDFGLARHGRRVGNRLRGFGKRFAALRGRSGPEGVHDHDQQH